VICLAAPHFKVVFIITLYMGTTSPCLYKQLLRFKCLQGVYGSYPIQTSESRDVKAFLASVFARLPRCWLLELRVACMWSFCAVRVQRDTGRAAQAEVEESLERFDTNFFPSRSLRLPALEHSRLLCSWLSAITMPPYPVISALQHYSGLRQSYQEPVS
jgi:hypothetical protein